MKPDRDKEQVQSLIQTLNQLMINEIPLGSTADERTTLADAERAFTAAIEKLQWYVQLRKNPLGSKG